jgi:Domain of unknown function (DUF4359)
MGKSAIAIAAIDRQNLLVFSIYTTEIPGKTFTTVGVFGNFLTF